MRKPYLLLLIAASILIGCKKDYSGWNVYHNSKIKLIDVPANPDCPAGGVLVQSGLDKNQNDMLDSAEVDQAEMICNGTVGEGPSTGVSPDGPRQVIIQLNMMTANTASATGIVVGSFPYFSKTYYPGYDSIVFVGQPYTNPTETNTATVELYDLTNNQVIANSAIASNKGLGGFEVSKNIYSALPDQEITLGIRLVSANEGLFAGVYTQYLYLYKR